MRFKNARANGSRSGPVAIRFGSSQAIRPQPGTRLHCKITDMGPVRHTVYLFTSRLSLVLIAPTNGGMARLS